MMTNNERETVYQIAKTLAGHRGIKCNGNTCANCDHDCSCLEVAYQTFASGYRKNQSHAKNNVMKSAPFMDMVDQLAKTIAFNRGYGCNDQDCCERCICYGNCIPRDMAKALIKEGYRKVEV